MNSKALISICTIGIAALAVWWFTVADNSVTDTSNTTIPITGEVENPPKPKNLESPQGSPPANTEVEDRPPSPELASGSELVPDKSVLRDHGYLEVDGEADDYRSYDSPTVAAMAETGDLRAELEAVIRGDLNLTDRKRFAISAARKGYTTALVRLGLNHVLDPSSSDSASDPVEGIAMLLASKELGDPGANDDGVWQLIEAQTTQAQRKLAKERVEEIVLAVRTGG